VLIGHTANCRSAVAMALNQRHCDIFIYKLNSIRKGDEHPTFRWGIISFNFFSINKCMNTLCYTLHTVHRRGVTDNEK